jgi:metal-responsive CopG/Arc/MetJ family transcriptional regulator
MRTLIDIPDDQVAELAEIAKRDKVSRASLVRKAISDLLDLRRRTTTDAFEAAFGLRPDMEDGLAYQERLRGEW